MSYKEKMQIVVETPLFVKQVAELFTEDQRIEMINFLAENPLVGDKIRGTDDVRILSFRARGRGARGGARVIHYWYCDGAPIYALLAYRKSEKFGLNPEETEAVVAFAAAIKAANRSKR